MRTLVFNLILTTLLLAQQVKPILFDHSRFDKLLDANVNESGLVDYQAFLESKEFEDYLNQIASAKTADYEKEEKLAFYINAYNAAVIKNVLNHWEITSPFDVDGFFEKYKFTVAGEELTLNEIEYNIIFPIEPLLSHFGLVCAALSCPKLLTKAYTAENVYEQLEENGKIFVNDRSRNQLDRDNKILYLSEIFKWFEDTFEKQFGSLKNTAMNFINEQDKKFLENNEVEIQYMKYNWQLNVQ